MANIIVSPLRVPRVARNGRIYTGNISLSQSGAGGAAVNLDWVSVTEDLVTINRDLHVTGNISASEEVIAWIAGAVESDVLANLTASAPLRKSTDSNIVLDFNTTQFEVNVSNQLQIKAGVLTPAEHTHDASDVISGIFDVARIPDLAISKITGLQTALNNKIETSLIGSVNGIAELDGSGKVLSAQLPSYVDDVLEYSNLAAFPVTGESGKIYIAQDTNLSYRWTGSGYAEISPSIALGETSSTAYRGDRGKIAYDHSQVITGNPHQIGIDDLTDGSNVAKLGAANMFSTTQKIISGASDVDGEVLRFRRDIDENRYNSIFSKSGAGGTATITFKVHDGITATSQTDVLKLDGNGTSIFSGSLRVDKQGDGAELLRLNTERAWTFNQRGTGAGAILSLEDVSGGKSFRIFDANSSRVGANFSPNGYQELNGNGVKRFETTSIGVSVSGHLAASSAAFTGTVDLGPSTAHVMGSHYYHRMYGGNTVYTHFYPNGGNGTTISKSNQRVWNGAGAYKTLAFDGSGSFTWDGYNIYTEGNDSNLAKLDAANTFTNTNIFSNSGTMIRLYNPAGTVNQRTFYFAGGDIFSINRANDAGGFVGRGLSIVHATGNILINTGTDNGNKLQVDGSLSATAGTFSGIVSTRSKYELRDGTGVLKWSFELSGDDLVLKNSAGTIRGKIDQTGNLSVEGEVTAYATL